MDVTLRLGTAKVRLLSLAISQCLHPERTYLLHVQLSQLVNLREELLAQAETQSPLPPVPANGKRP